MKAALDAWGFHQGAATQSDDPDVIAATIAKPGVVLSHPRQCGGVALRILVTDGRPVCGGGGMPNASSSFFTTTVLSDRI